MVARTRIPPPPVHSEDKTIWNNWYVSIKDAINNLRGDLKWVNLDFASSNITDISAKSHQDLDNLQGGSTTERYHLTAAQASNYKAFLHATATLDFPSIAANTTEELTITVTGAVVGSVVMLGPPSAIEAGLLWCGYVSAANTVTVRIHNQSGGAVNPASATWHVLVEVD